MYFSGQGKVYIAKRATSGDPLAFRPFGNVTELQLSPSVETVEHKESQTGLRLTDKRIRTSKSMEISATLEDFSAENVALALHGKVVSVTSGTVSAEAFPDSLVAGDVIALKNADVSDVVIEDSADSPATLTLNTHYTLNADHGSVTFLDVDGFTQPFKADYSYAAVTGISMFNDTAEEVALRFEGLNTADDDDAQQPVLVRVHKVSLDPTDGLQLIQDEFGNFSLSGMALQDTTKASDADLGQYGDIIYLS